MVSGVRSWFGFRLLGAMGAVALSVDLQNDRSVDDAIEEEVKVFHDRSPLRVEGLSELQWVLIDYGDAVVHVFSDEIRAYYEIERLYRDVPKVDWELERD